MKRLALAAIVAGVLVGQSFNGPQTEAFGVYLLVLAALLIVFGVTTLPGQGGES